MVYVPAVLMTVGVAVLSLWEAPQLPPPVMSLGDKVLHGLLYTVLAMTWMAPVAVRKYGISTLGFQIWSAVGVVAGVTMYGGLMEVLQRYCTRTRSGEWLDVIADLIGAVVGVGIVFGITVLRYHGITKKSKI